MQMKFIRGNCRTGIGHVLFAMSVMIAVVVFCGLGSAKGHISVRVFFSSACSSCDEASRNVYDIDKRYSGNVQFEYFNVVVPSAVI